MRRLSDLRIATRLYLLGLITVVAVGLLAVSSTVELRNDQYAAREKALAELVGTAVSLVEQDYALEQKCTLTREQAQAAAVQHLKALRYDKDGYFWINDMTPRMVMHPTKPELDGSDLSGLTDPDGTAVFIRFVDVVKAHGAGVVRYQWPKPGAEEPQPKVSYVAGFEPWGWVIGSGVYVDDVNATVMATAWRNLATAGALLLIVVLLSYGVARSIVRPIRSATTVLSSGNVRARLDTRAGRTELDELAGALNAMMDHLIGVIEEVGAATRGLQLSALSLTENSVAILDTARQSEALSGDSSRSSREVSSSIDTLASGFRELEGSIESIGHNAREAADVAARAVDAARTTTQAVSDLGDSSAEIGEVIKTITSIAEQTNLLALNATIEAARAGESGRGFAVVANEVKDLARETATATEDIARRVQAIQGATQESAAAIGEIAEIISRINDHQAGIARAVAEQTATSAEMSSAVAAAARASAEVADALDGVLTSAQVTAHGVDEVTSTAVALADVVTQLSHATDAFTAT